MVAWARARFGDAWLASAGIGLLTSRDNLRLLWASAGCCDDGLHPDCRVRCLRHQGSNYRIDERDERFCKLRRSLGDVQNAFENREERHYFVVAPLISAMQFTITCSMGDP